MRWSTSAATAFCLVQCIVAFSLKPADVSASSEEEPFIHAAKDTLSCPRGTFESVGRTECRPCSLCGPDLYVRHACTARKDTVCDWCLNKSPLQNEDFESKCTEVVRTHAELTELVGDPELDDNPLESKSESTEVEDDTIENSSELSENGRRHYLIRIEAMETPMRTRCWKHVEPILDAFFYLALICLVVVAIRHIYKRRQTQTHRTIVVAPPMFDDVDNKNIIRAAENIKCKLGKKGYERLEEFI